AGRHRLEGQLRQGPSAVVVPLDDGAPRRHRSRRRRRRADVIGRQGNCRRRPIRGYERAGIPHYRRPEVTDERLGAVDVAPTEAVLERGTEGGQLGVDPFLPAPELIGACTSADVGGECTEPLVVAAPQALDV